MNKKGFTLAELILVIFVVGLLTVLATTVIFNHVSKTRKDAAYRSAINYVAAINDYNFISEGVNLINSGNTSTITPKLKDSYDGNKPTSGTVVIDPSTNKVAAAELYFDNYKVTYDGNIFTIVKQ